MRTRQQLREDRLFVVAFLLGLALGFLGGVGVAKGATPTEMPSTAVALDFPILRGAEAVAEAYWPARGVALPPLEGAYELPDEEQWVGYLGAADPTAGRIWLGVEVLENLDTPLRQVNVRSRVILCYNVLHERGHNAGLQHSDAGTFPVMAPTDEVGAGWLRKEVAPRCWTWAKHPFG